MGSLFLSYSGTDREIAAQLAAGLNNIGIEIWWDRNEIGWGDNWIAKLEDALSRCESYVVLVGPSGIRKWVKAELYLAIKRHFEHDLPIFPLLLPGVTPTMLPGFLAIFQAAPLPDDLNKVDFGVLANRLSKGRCGAQTAIVTNDVCPFPGLEAFGEDDARFFFGRHKEAVDAIRRLGIGLDGVYHRWLHIEGASGVGKSSLVKAGLIPAIKQGWAGSIEAQTWRQWTVGEPMRPGRDPILNLADVLIRIGADTPERSINKLYRMLRADDQALTHFLREVIPKNVALVLIVDQLEEVFTHTEDVTLRGCFDALIANALTDLDGCFHLVTTIRSDFMMRFVALPRLQALLNENASRYFLEPVQRAGLIDIVRTPARLAGLQWSDDILPDDIVEQASGEPGALPLVQNLLRLLWQKRRHGDVLSRDDYRALGGVGGALAQSADQLIESLGEAKESALNLLTALVSIGQSSHEGQDSRRTITKADAIRAAGSGQRAELIINRLSGLRGPEMPQGEAARPRLIIISNKNASHSRLELVDLAHETLLRYDRNNQPFWKTLRDRITTKRKMLEDRQLLETLAENWREQNSPRFSALATRAQLRNFLRLPDVPEHTDLFLKASRHAIRLQNWAGGVIALGISLLLILAWAGQQQLSVRYTWLKLISILKPVYLEPQDMVELKAGLFRMGDVHGRGTKDEQPVHTVSIQKSFKMARHEVTFQEYDRFALSTGRRLPNDWTFGRDRRPVIDVTWSDATAYGEWLSRVTGKRYRLPSEAEWEYAARSGGKEEIWAGSSDEKELIQYAQYNINSSSQGEKKLKTWPVGTRKPNGLGLYDMSGNVWEWTQDCFHETYEGSPNVGNAWLSESQGECESRILRGGSYFDSASSLRTADRLWYKDFGIRNFNVGFRLVQDIN